MSGVIERAGALLWLVSLACTVEGYDPEGRACAGEHPCPEPLVCVQGFCRTSVLPPDGGPPFEDAQPVDAALGDGGQDAEVGIDRADAEVGIDRADAEVGAEPAAADGGRPSSDAACPLDPCLPSGLKLWLDPSERVTTTAGDQVTSWQDALGRTTTATQTDPLQRPALNANGWNGVPVLVFDGVDDGLTGVLRINGWTEMTLVLAASAGRSQGTHANSQGSAVLWEEVTAWSTTFITPFRDRIAFRFGTTQRNNEPSYVRTSSDASPGIMVSVKRGTVDFLRVNGREVVRESGKLATIGTTTGEVYIGKGHNLTPFLGSVGDILVYDRALSTEELVLVEGYLRTKHGITNTWFR